MSKRFNIRLALEAAEPEVKAPLLEVDKEAALTPEQKAIRDTAEQTEATPKNEVTDGTETPTETPTEGTGETSEVLPVDEKPKEMSEESGEGTPADETDIAEDAKDKDDEKESVDDALDAKTSLEAIANIMVGSLGVGGLSPSAAKASSVVLESLYNQIGYKSKKHVFPALESFGSYSARQQQTRLALEGVEEAINVIWRAIATSLGKMAGRIKDMFGKFIFMCRSYQGQIKVLRIALDKADREIPKIESFSNRSVIRNLTIDHGFDPEEALKAMTGLVGGFTKATSDTCHKNLNLIKTSFASAVFGQGIKKLPRLITDSNSILQGLKKVSYGEGTAGADHYSLTKFPAGVKVDADLPKENLDDIEYLTTLQKCYVSVNNEGLIKHTYDEVSIGTKDQIGEILDQCQMAVNAIDTAWHVVNKILEGSEFASIMRIIQAEEHMKADEETELSSSREHLIDLNRAIAVYTSTIDKLFLDPIMDSVRHTQKAISAAISFSDTSIRAYV